MAIIAAGIAVGLIDMYAVRKTNKFKNAPGGGQFMQLATAFLLGFFKGIISIFATAFTAKKAKLFLAGFLEVAFLLFGNYNKIFHGKKISKKSFVNAFVDGYSGKSFNELMVGTTIDALFPYIKFEKTKNAVSFLLKFAIKIFKFDSFRGE